MELSFGGSCVRSVAECVQIRIGQVLGQLPIFNLSTYVSRKTISEQPEGHPDLNSHAEEADKGKDKRLGNRTVKTA